MQRNIKGLAGKSRFSRAFCTSHFNVLGPKPGFQGGRLDGASSGDAGRQFNAVLPEGEMICRGAGVSGAWGRPAEQEREWVEPHDCRLSAEVGDGRIADLVWHPFPTFSAARSSDLRRAQNPRFCGSNKKSLLMQMAGQPDPSPMRKAQTGGCLADVEPTPSNVEL